MRYEVVLPSLGDDAGDHATLSFWFIDAGAQVKEGEDLVEMVTDKATFNVPCPRNGRVVELKAKENQVVKVGEVMAVLEV